MSYLYPDLDDEHRLAGLGHSGFILHIIPDFLLQLQPMTDITERLTRFTTPEQRELIHLIAREANRLGMHAYLVGGFVRDLLLGRMVNDFDIVVVGNAITLCRSLVKKYGGRLTPHILFKTATWFLPETFAGHPRVWDLTSARLETYARPAALPTVTLGTLHDDLRRRDFTINAMALCLDSDCFGVLIDPLGGRADLEHGLIRVIHPRSFIDDPTRLFRAVRYAVRYGFRLAPETAALIPDALPYVDDLSPERLRHELDLIFEEGQPTRILERLFALGILQSIYPPLPSSKADLARLRRIRFPSQATSSSETPDLPLHEARWIAWLMALPTKEIRAIARRLHFTADLKKKVLAASSIFHNLDAMGGWTPSLCTAWLEGFPDQAIQVVSLCLPAVKARDCLKNYLEQWKTVRPLTNGETLKALGLPPGPLYKEWLWQLRAAWLDGAISTAAEEEMLLHKLIEERRQKHGDTNDLQSERM